MADSRPLSTLSFADLGLPGAVVEALAGEGITAPFPIQAATLPHSLAGRDVLGRGRTGSGKTYALPAAPRHPPAPARRARRPKQPRGLILVPTRELATPDRHRPRPAGPGHRPAHHHRLRRRPPSRQVDALRHGVDIVIACPGRLKDLMQQGTVDLDRVEITVLDEADHMADLGFLPGVSASSTGRPRNGQRMLFSATLDNGVDVLVKRYLDRPGHAQRRLRAVAGDDHGPPRAPRRRATTASRSSPTSPPRPGRTRDLHAHQARRQGARQQLNAHGVPAVELHGNLSQNARTRNLAAFSDGARAPCSSPPTSPRVASTSTTSPWSSTPTRRPSTRRTSTAPAARPAPAPRAPWSRSCWTTSAPTSAT